MRYTVHPFAWSQVDASTQDALQRRAAELGGTIEVHADPWMGDDPQIIVMYDEHGREDAQWAGYLECGRPPWEHELRWRLGLSDPCIRGIPREEWPGGGR